MFSESGSSAPDLPCPTITAGAWEDLLLLLPVESILLLEVGDGCSGVEHCVAEGT